MTLSLLHSSSHGSNSHPSLLTFIQEGDPNQSAFVNLLVALRFQIPSHPIFHYGAVVPPEGFRFIHTTGLPYVKHIACAVDFGLGIQSFPKAIRMLLAFPF
jgi:hypothetical protein